MLICSWGLTPFSDLTSIKRPYDQQMDIKIFWSYIFHDQMIKTLDICLVVIRQSIFCIKIFKNA